MLDVEDGVFEAGRIAEGVVVSNGVHNEEALSVLDVQIPHADELLCSGSVEDLQGYRHVVDFRVLTVEVLDSGIVLLDEGSAAVLDGEGALTYTPGSKDYNLVLSSRHPSER